MDVLAARVQWWVMKMKWLRVRTWLWGFSVVLVSADLHTVYVRKCRCVLVAEASLRYLFCTAGGDVVALGSTCCSSISFS